MVLPLIVILCGWEIHPSISASTRSIAIGRQEAIANVLSLIASSQHAIDVRFGHDPLQLLNHGSHLGMFILDKSNNLR
jgi:hypothetical protein